jgi:AcrR family transcriptional regulator
MATASTSYTALVSAEPGLRQRKKQRTQELIAETARRLFAERGFEDVTVAEVARAAEVSEGTVFNYFPTKEELFYGGMEAFEAQLVEAVRSRPAGESVLDAFRRVVLGGTERLASEEVAQTIAAAAPIVRASRALQAREREVVARYTGDLADVIREETGAGRDTVEPAAVAAALMGAQRALVAYVHARVLAGERGAKLARGARREGTRAFDRLEHGLAGYVVKGKGTSAGRRAE